MVVNSFCQNGNELAGKFCSSRARSVATAGNPKSCPPTKSRARSAISCVRCSSASRCSKRTFVCFSMSSCSVPASVTAPNPSAVARSETIVARSRANNSNNSSLSIVSPKSGDCWSSIARKIGTPSASTVAAQLVSEPPSTVFRFRSTVGEKFTTCCVAMRLTPSSVHCG